MNGDSRESHWVLVLVSNGCSEDDSADIFCRYIGQEVAGRKGGRGGRPRGLLNGKVNIFVLSPSPHTLSPSPGEPLHSVKDGLLLSFLVAAAAAAAAAMAG